MCQYLYRAGLLVAILSLASQLPATKSTRSPRAAGSLDPASKIRISDSYGKLPFSFEENRGQFDEEVKFLCRGSGYTLFLTSTEAVLSLRRGAPEPKDRLSTWDSVQAPKGESVANDVVRLNLIGANSSPNITGMDELPGKSNYFTGNDPAKWRTDLPTYAKVKYEDVYPGIDLVYYGNQRRLEYDWIVAPGADPGDIRFTVESGEPIEIEAGGDLVWTGEGDVRFRSPVVYQERQGVRTEIAGGYVLRDGNQVGFQVERYDSSLPLVIDPILVYSTYLGGSFDDFAYGITLDSAGSAYITGLTGSTDFPTENPFQATSGASLDTFITKLNSSGSQVVYSTYIGGSHYDYGYGIAVDPAGNAYITGKTWSSDFPTLNPFQAAHGGGNTDAFFTKLNPAGNALVCSTYLGGSGGDYGYGIAADHAGQAYVIGATASFNFPKANPFQADHSGGVLDGFVTKLAAAGNTLVYSSYLGGNSTDVGYGIALDSAGSAYLTGSTNSTDFPVVNPYQAGGIGDDAFVAKLSAAGNTLVYSTYLGGGGEEDGKGIAVDSAGSAYVTGYTNSTNFPTVNPFQALAGASGDAFVTKLNIAGNGLVYSTYLGGSGNDEAKGIAVDSAGNAYIAGWTYSTDFPTEKPIRAANVGGNSDAFVAKLNVAGSALAYSTYLGGTSRDGCGGVAVDFMGNAYVAGQTNSTNFPTQVPWQAVSAGSSDIFIARIGEPPPLLKITMSNTAYSNGNTVAATEFRLQNPGPLTASELKVWLGIPGIPPIGVLNLGADGNFVLPAGFDQELGPIPLFTVDPGLPRGTYEFSSRMVEPVTGDLLSEDLNPFEIQ